MNKLQITMVHDLVCSWCPIAYQNIKTALEKLKIDVDFHFLPFELNPKMAKQGESIASYFSRQFNWDEQKLLSYQGSLATKAANAGAVIDFSKRTSYFNSYNGHLLMHWAARFNQQEALNECLIKAYFEQGVNISDPVVLLDIAAQLGFNRDAANSALLSSQLRLELANKMARVKSLNINSVPAFLFNNNTVITDSHSVAYFEQTLTAYLNGSVNIV